MGRWDWDTRKKMKLTAHARGIIVAAIFATLFIFIFALTAKSMDFTRGNTLVTTIVLFIVNLVAISFISMIVLLFSFFTWWVVVKIVLGVYRTVYLREIEKQEMDQVEKDRFIPGKFEE